MAETGFRNPDYWVIENHIPGNDEYPADKWTNIQRNIFVRIQVEKMVQQKLDLPRLFFFYFIFREVKKTKSETVTTVVLLNKSRLFHVQDVC